MKEVNEHATCKEFGKMLRQVADLYARMGDRPLAEEMMEYAFIKDRIGFITTKHAYDYFLAPLKDDWLRYGFDVDEAKAWGEHVMSCRANGKEPDYEGWSKDKENNRGRGHGL